MSLVDKIRDAIHKVEVETLAFINWTEEEFKLLAKYITDSLDDKDAEVIANELVEEFKQLKADLIAGNTKAVLDDVISMVATVSKLHDSKEGLDTFMQLLTKLSNDYTVFKDSKVFKDKRATD
jgi:hypothetical protein